MGNLSHPSINRWGLNLFWYNFWYSDKNKTHSSHQDVFLNRLVLIYINYGLSVDRNLFFSTYWYSNKSKFYNEQITLFNKNLPISFRFVNYKNKVNNELTLVKLRIKLKNLHFTKLWILRFQNWIIINMYLIQPLKKNLKYTKKKKINRNFFLDKHSNKKIKKISFLRLLFFLKYLNKKQLFFNNYYSF